MPKLIVYLLNSYSLEIRVINNSLDSNILKSFLEEVAILDKEVKRYFLLRI